ncbi:S8 family peptidase [Magnetospirillum sp. UT-4]|uniref:S8 family peptidase n=1 Tax=Magnetospirillum sp. UT-4 TaxID=2681467 RepID=UPI001572FFE0|nr:S8 family peptidase [Magnetospirillum sp. UT-4]
MRAVWTSVCALAVAGALSNCGGGGGGGGLGGGGVIDRIGSGSSGVRTGPADFNAELGRNYGLGAVGADAAHAAGQTGTGVTVAVIDTGIDVQHKDFAGAIAAASTDIVSGLAANVDDQGGHGTSVAGIVGARADGYDAVGVAPDATLLAVRSEYTCSPKCSFAYSDLANATDYARLQGAKVMNFSLGGDSIGADFQAALARATGDGRVVVAAAGNTGGANPINPAAWLAGVDAGGLGLAVGAVDATNTIASFSNRAGTAKDRFLVAPGVNVVTTANGGGTQVVSGTSFAAPHVAGAAAVVWGASPFLTGAEVADILLQSARDLGDPGTDAVYGRGLLDVDQALQPVGGTSVPTGTTVADGGAAPAATALSLGGAFGDALSRGTGLDRAMVLDAYGRPFAADLSARIRAAPAEDRLAGWLAPSGGVTTTRLDAATALTLAAPPEPDHLRLAPGEEAAAPRFALSTRIGATELGAARGFGLDRLTGLAASGHDGGGMVAGVTASPFTAMGGDGSALAAGQDIGNGIRVAAGFSQEGGGESALPAPERRLAMAEASRRFEGGAVAGLQGGRLSEGDGPLSSAGAGAFGFERPAATDFVDLFGALPLGPRSELFGRWGMGRTDGAALDGGLLRGGGDLYSQSFAVGTATREVMADGDRVAFTLSRPLRVNAGSATLAVPTGRTMDGTIVYREETLDLTPTGAETDLELTWSVTTGERQDLTLGGMLMLEPGHDASAAPGFAAGAKYRFRW